MHNIVRFFRDVIDTQRFEYNVFVIDYELTLCSSSYPEAVEPTYAPPAKCERSALSIRLTGKSLVMADQGPASLGPVATANTYVLSDKTYLVSHPIHSDDDIDLFFSNNIRWINPMALVVREATTLSDIERAVEGIIVQAYDGEGYVLCLRDETA